jgi:hypothetical protein
MRLKLTNRPKGPLAKRSSGGGTWTHIPNRIAYRFIEERPL